MAVAWLSPGTETFKALFKELIACSFIYALLRRWGVGPTPGSAAHRGVRGTNQRSPQAQGRSEAPSGSVLSWVAALRGRWHSVLSHQHAPSQKTNAQGAHSAWAGSVSQSRRGRHGRTGPAQSAGRL